jgi:hypothetical protein
MMKNQSTALTRLLSVMFVAVALAAGVGCVTERVAPNLEQGGASTVVELPELAVPAPAPPADDVGVPAQPGYDAAGPGLEHLSPAAPIIRASCDDNACFENCTLHGFCDGACISNRCMCLSGPAFCG